MQQPKPFTFYYANKKLQRTKGSKQGTKLIALTYGKAHESFFDGLSFVLELYRFSVASKRAFLTSL